MKHGAKTALTVAGLLALAALVGCGTVEGIGRDISDGARAVRGAF